MFAQPSPDCSSLFGSEVKRKILLLRIKESELRPLVLIDDCEDAGYRFADVVAVERSRLAVDSKHRFCWTSP